MNKNIDDQITFVPWDNLIPQSLHDIILSVLSTYKYNTNELILRLVIVFFIFLNY